MDSLMKFAIELHRLYRAGDITADYARQLIAEVRAEEAEKASAATPA